MARAPEWFNWADTLSGLPQDVRGILARYNFKYLDHTDECVVFLGDGLSEQDRAFVSPALFKSLGAFSGAKEVRAREQWFKDKEFCQGKLWRDIRYRVFAEQGNWCRCCGSRPPYVALHIDHIVPRSVNPTLALEFTNLQVLCRDCNGGKGATIRDWRKPWSEYEGLT